MEIRIHSLTFPSSALVDRLYSEGEGDFAPCNQPVNYPVSASVFTLQHFRFYRCVNILYFKALFSD